MTNDLAPTIMGYIKTLLTPYGFKKHNSDFILEHKNLSCIINIQKSKYTEQFTLNWGVYLPMFSEFYKTNNETTAFRNCVISNRAPILKPPGYDSWWSKNLNSKDIKELDELLLEYVLPFLSSINTIQDVIVLLGASIDKSSFKETFSVKIINDSVWLAIIYSFLNQKEKSYKILDNLINNPSTNQLYRETLIAVKEKIENFKPKAFLT